MILNNKFQAYYFFFYWSTSIYISVTVQGQIIVGRFG